MYTRVEIVRNWTLSQSGNPIYTLLRGLKSDFLGNWFFHQILLLKEPHFGYFKVIQIRLCLAGNFDGFSKGTLVNQKCGAMWWPLWPILENYCLKTLTWILPLKAIALIQYQKSCNLVQGQWFCDFCSIEIFKSKKQWSHNIQKSCHSFETIIAINGHSALRGRQHHHLFVP